MEFLLRALDIRSDISDTTILTGELGYPRIEVQPQKNVVKAPGESLQILPA